MLNKDTAGCTDRSGSDCFSDGRTFIVRFFGTNLFNRGGTMVEVKCRLFFDGLRSGCVIVQIASFGQFVMKCTRFVVISGVSDGIFLLDARFVQCAATAGFGAKIPTCKPRAIGQTNANTGCGPCKADNSTRCACNSTCCKHRSNLLGATEAIISFRTLLKP